ncbi:GNAT family N-acetyltransferase [Luteolibacter yonseiensis]
MDLITLCMEELLSQGIHQWDHIYPDISFVEADARAGTLHLIRENGVCVGCVSLDDEQPDAYAAMPWKCSTGRAMVMHRLAVRPDRQGRGIGRMLMDHAEAHARQSGFSCIRLDTYTGNPRALSMYARRGYEPVGQVWFPRRELAFDCMELVLK